jgi:hypothetical protein
VRTVLLLTGATLVLFGLAAEAGAASLVPHRAVYDLSLRETRKPNAVERVAGRMVYEFTGNACEGYTSSARQVTEMVDPEGDSSLSDLQSKSWEDAAGKTYRFESRTFTDRELSKEIEGSAARRADGMVDVTMKKPAAGASDLAPPVLFPTQHTMAILQGAEAGAATLPANVFDGASDGSKLFATLAVIGAGIPATETAGLEPAALGGQLAGARRWPVRVSYFDDGAAKAGEETPLYTMGFELFDNGVSRALRIDYGDFVLDGTLSTIEFLPQKPCAAAP